MKSAVITVSFGTISFAANSPNTIGYIKNKWFDELDTNPIIIHSGVLLLKNFFLLKIQQNRFCLALKDSQNITSSLRTHEKIYFCLLKFFDNWLNHSVYLRLY